MKNQNILIAFAVLFVIGVVAFTFLVPFYYQSDEDSDLDILPDFTMPQLTDAEREKLGPKNDLAALDWLPSDGMFGYIAHPRRLLESPLLAEGVDFLSQELMRLTMLPLDMKKVELLLNYTSIRQAVIPPQPGEPVTPQILPIPYACYYVQLVEPIDKQAFLSLLVPRNSGFQVRMRTVEGKETYDLPAGFPLKTHALVFLDEKTMLYVLGDEDLLKDALSGKAPTGPLADRMARVKVSESDIVFVGSAETGLQLPPGIVENIAYSSGLPETLVKSVLDNFRAVQLTLNMSAAEKEPLLALKFETLKSEGAKEIVKTINEQIVFYRSSLSLLQPKNLSVETVSEEDWTKLGEQVLDSIDISSQESIVSASLLHFPTLSTHVSEYFRNQRQFIAEMEAQQRQRMIMESVFQRITTIRTYLLMYHNEKGEFPAAAICDAAGNPLLSWRVAILPHMGESELYSQFNLEEPWDGPTNRPLIGKMPSLFGDARAYDPTRTTVRLFNSAGTPFGRLTLKMTDVPGQQTTVMLVAVSPENAVEWTRPDTLAPCETVEDYAKIFGPLMPVLFFDGRNGTLPLGSIPEMEHPKFLEFLKNSIEGKPVN